LAEEKLEEPLKPGEPEKPKEDIKATFKILLNKKMLQLIPFILFRGFNLSS